MVAARPLVAVWTRDRSASAAAGRPRIIAALQDGPLCQGKQLRLQHLFELRVLDQCLAAVRWAWRMCTLRPLPLQVAMYGSPRAVRRILRGVRGAAAIYLDGVRCSLLAEALARLAHRPRLICDLDDLMSRRFRLYREHAIVPQLGYLRSSCPGWIRGVVQRLSTAITAYEALALRRCELALVRRCRASVLLSSTEAAELRARCRGRRILCLPPPQPLAAIPAPLRAPLRCLFIGSAELPQNRLTLLRLCAWWREFGLTRDLDWVGRNEPPLELPDRIHALGFVADLASVYDGRHVLVIPSVLPGGIKTKVLEALAHGCPVLGNAAAFDGLPWAAHYPLVLPDDPAVWAEWIERLDERQAQLEHALALGRRCLLAHHDPVRWAQRWERVMGWHRQ